jgi:2-polyprenyl-3-methyl-5-hydroxy-6-metoxy-1,4-benzoquinol methylase
MPFPIDGLGQHYEVEADDYFAAHDKAGKLGAALSLVVQAEELLGRVGKLLDVGSGRGEILVTAKERGWIVEGVEPSESFAEYSKERTGAKIWQNGIEDLDLPSDEFDVIVLAAVLEHLYDPDQVVHKLSRALKKGGLLYLDVPNEKGLYFVLGNTYQKLRGRNWCVNLAPTFSPFHVFGFSPRSLKALLAKHELKPKILTVCGGTSLVPSRGGVAGRLESYAAKLVTSLSRFGKLGTYIETWAVRDGS